MIAAIIRWSVSNRILVILAAAAIAVGGIWGIRATPLDALPDLSDVQVILRTTYPGQAPDLVETQITYPLTTTMLSVPGARTVRGYSFFGDSFVYVLFEDGTDPYWARSRVLEALAQIENRLPSSARFTLGPDATGVGWIYTYALVDRTGQHDLGQLRSLQDWFLRYELKTVPDIAEVASLGGMVKQYQVVLDPVKLLNLGLTADDVAAALKAANQSTGGSVLELAEAEYMVRSPGYLHSVSDIASVVVRSGASGGYIRVGDVATVQAGPEMRRGVAELNGQGEVAGGIIVLRSGKNAWNALQAVHAKMDTLKKSLPPGVEIVTTYDRSDLIGRAVETLTHKLIEEFVIVALVCGLFLLHLRSSLVAIVTLPLGILASFIVMHFQGLTANIMSLGGIAIAIGAMVDASVVMIENAHKHLEQWRHQHDDCEPPPVQRWAIITGAAVEVGPALFLALLIITLSFIPVFTLEAQEGRLFAPLAFTKTYAMAAAAGLSVTLVPVLMGYLIRGRIRSEVDNPVNRVLGRLYAPCIDWALRRPRTTLVVAAVLLLLSMIPMLRLGSEFMPPLDEGDLLYMPTALPGLSIGKATQLLQQTDRMILTVPEVASVMGKSGRADTATDPAPLEMFETTVRLKPRDDWRPGLTMDRIVAELDQTVQVPGLTNVWVPPIRNRIDMLATGIKSPVGIKISGPDLETIDRLASNVADTVRGVPGVTSAFAERLAGGRYVDIKLDRTAIGRYGLTLEQVQSFIATAIGGEPVAEIIEGRARYSMNVRFPRELRDSVDGLRHLTMPLPGVGVVELGDVARIKVADGPAMIRSENARPSGWVYVDVRGRDLSSVVSDMQNAVTDHVQMPPAYALSWSGQFEYLERATARLKLVVPATLFIVLIMLYLTFRRWDEAVMLLMTLPLALAGGMWLIWLLGHAVSVATVVGFIALAGVAAEFAIVMLIYLKASWERSQLSGKYDEAALLAAVREGALLRVRPKAMTVAVILAGLLPVVLGTGTGSEVMQRIAAPMVGGMITAPLLSMIVVPAAYVLMRRRTLQTKQTDGTRLQSADVAPSAD
ncbi:MAG: efflux RND transporter permease subunit [Sphingomonadales bacterium]